MPPTCTNVARIMSMTADEYQEAQIRNKRVWLLSEIERFKFEIVKLESQVELLDRLVTKKRGRPRKSGAISNDLKPAKKQKRP